MRFTEIAKKKPVKSKPKTKAEIEELRYSIQAGTVTQRQAFSIKKLLVGIIGKYATGDDWAVKQNFLDAGLYYEGEDLNEANRIGKEIVGALYGFFQDGARRSVTKLKREEDNQTMSFTAIPMDDQGNKAPPQISFTWYKNAQTGGPVIAININAPR